MEKAKMRCGSTCWSARAGGGSRSRLPRCVCVVRVCGVPCCLCVQVVFKKGSPNHGFFASYPDPPIWGALLLDYVNETKTFAHAENEIRALKNILVDGNNIQC